MIPLALLACGVALDDAGRSTPRPLYPKLDPHTLPHSDELPRPRVRPDPAQAAADAAIISRIAHRPGPHLEVVLLDDPLSPSQIQAWLEARASTPVENRPLDVTRHTPDKPAGGVAWTSQQRQGPGFISGWAEFACSEYEAACVPQAMLLEASPEARVIDLDEALALGGRGVTSRVSGREIMDWERLARAGVDAVHYSMESAYLEGWDAESTVWLSPSKLRAVRLVALDRGQLVRG